MLPPTDFESVTSANSITPAKHLIIIIKIILKIKSFVDILLLSVILKAENGKEMLTVEKLTDNIVELNRDMEPYIVQGTASRPWLFKRQYEEKFKPIQFVHFSDVHNVLDLWNRTVEYINYYSEYISFALHTGDACGDYQELYTDFYNEGTKCVRPIYPCIGNHDTVTTEKHLPASKESIYNLFFAPAGEEALDGIFMEGDFSTTYYKDFPESNLRLIVLDLYNDIKLQCDWLKKVLDDAKEKGLCVITSMHEPTDKIHNTFDVTFHSRNDYSVIQGVAKQKEFEPVIADFIKQGGIHICNLAGNEHHDLFGLTDAGILNVVVQAATTWDGFTDGKRIKGTRTYDCFNVVSIDANVGLLKIARIGNNIDHYFRSQRSLCYDYINKKVIHND